MSSAVANGTFLSHLAGAWLPMLLDAAVKGIVVLGLACVATAWMRRAPAAARHLVWLAALASLAVLPILSAGLPGWNVLPGWMMLPVEGREELAPSVEMHPALAEEAAWPAVPLDTAPLLTEAIPAQPLPASPIEETEAAPTATLSPPVLDGVMEPAGSMHIWSWRAWALLAWLAGTALALAPLALGRLSLWRLERRSDRVSDGPWAALLKELAAESGVKRRVGLLLSDRRSMPMQWGIVRPRLLLPVAAKRWPTDRVRLVLLHELGHVRRWDCLAQLAGQIVCAVYWFNPLAWMAVRRMQWESEAACDDLALEAGYKPSDYAQHLLEIASGLEAHLFAACAAIAMARRSRLEGRLLGILDPRRSRRSLTRATALLVVGLLVGVMVPMAMLRAADARVGGGEQLSSEEKRALPETETDGRTYDCFLYVRHNREDERGNNSLVLARVTSEGFEQRELYTTDNLGMSWRPLCVAGGKVYGIRGGDLIAIDVTTAEAEAICQGVMSHCYDSGRLYALVGNRTLRVFDLRSRTYRDVCRVEIAHFHRVPIAVSKDHRRLAFFRGVGKVSFGMATSAFRLHTVDLERGTVGPLGSIVYSASFMGGGGDICDPPSLVWLDPKTILFAHDVPKHAPKDPERAGWIEIAETRVATIDVATGRLTDLVKLPRRAGGLREPYLRPLGKDGMPRIVMNELGQYRLDVRGKRLIEDDRVDGDYRWSRGPQPERLSHGTTLLAQQDAIPEVGVSPDGRRVLWLTGRYRGSELRYFDVHDKTVRVVGSGWFLSNRASLRRPDETVFLWADAEDLEPAGPPEPPAGWERFSPRPWPEPRPRQADERPKLADFVRMTLATDKRSYYRHEPLQLTVTLTNPSDTDVTFRRPPEYSEFFGLRMEYPRGWSRIGEFGASRAVFPTDPVVIKAGESFQCTRTVEPPELGEHRIEGAFRLNTGSWRGRAEAEPIRFVVEESPEDSRLLEAKFDRLMARCRREFAQDPMTCDYGRFFALGPGAVPHLVAALESSDDAEFRQRIGLALAKMATADAIPYFEKLLEGDMQADREMVLDGLASVYRRSGSEEALGLLFVALEHPNAECRRGAAARLAKFFEPRVAVALKAAIADADGETATAAARFLAAYEGLDLADWLAAAADEPTGARYLAARQIIGQLEEAWHLKKGDLPDGPWVEVAGDPGKLSQYQKVVRAWQQWAQENARFSSHFFDADRPEDSRSRPSGVESGAGATQGAAAGNTTERADINKSNVRYAEALAAVAEAKYSQALEANRRHAGAIPGTELRRLELNRQVAQLEVERAEAALRGDEKAVLQVDIRRARTMAEIAEAKYLQAKEANLRVPGTVPLSELRRMKSASELATLEAQRAELAARGDEEALREIDVRCAELKAAGAKAEYEQAVEANRRHPGSVAAAEVRRLELAYQLARLEAERAELAARGDDKALREIDVRCAELKAAGAKAEYEQAVEANRRHPGSVPEAELKRLESAVGEAQRGLE